MIAETLISPHPLMMLPFMVMLLAIALAPILIKHHWEKQYHLISLGLGAISLAYYLIVLRAPARVLHVAKDYISFIALIGSLYVIAGGIHVRVRGGESKPWMNCVFLFVGGILASIIGTTGASMVMVRPWIRINKYRYTGLHTVFFIFIVSNVGGVLTPIGDPPLFLGYLSGVPFWWVFEHCWLGWVSAIGALLVIFYFLDRYNFVQAPQDLREAVTSSPEKWKVLGAHNLAFLGVILLAAFIKEPYGLREAIMIGAAIASYRCTSNDILEANDFTFAPIKEVAWLFIGIFATMIPALDYLEAHASEFGLSSPLQFYWLSGTLSGVLDNAPTYLTFLAAAFGLAGLDLEHPGHMHTLLSTHGQYLVAVSLGSVFFGAMTYIGNGPNLMVKAIADHAGVHTPSFFGYLLKYSIPVLLPILYLVSLIFF
jgi:Na+/H+ antiporter NhaD/arsenite permease-like protein